MDNWKPEGYNSVSPYIITPKVEDLLSFIKHVFEGVDVYQMKDDKGRVAHAEIRIHDSIVMLGDAGDNSQVGSHIHIYVPDVDKTFDRAIHAGSKSVQKPVQKNDPDKRGGFEDPFGAVTWWVGTQLQSR